MGTKERKTLGDVISETFLQEWDEEKNELTPFDYSYGSLQKTWWKCSYCSHSWETSVRNRANGSGCPICSRIKTDITKTDMWAEKLQVEWCESNGNPRQFGTGNSAKLDWKCQKCCNVWQATLTYRFGEDAKCPYCAGLKAIAGVNDFGTLYPDLFEEWDYDKNKENPTEITVKSSRINYWRCQLGHEWQASVQYRVERSSTCPVCANKKVLTGFNDLATTDPEFLEEWDYESNGRKRVLPEKVVRNSDTKVSWKCTAKGHTWRTSIRHRTISGSNCPTCYSENQGILKDREKSFGAMLPDLLQEWNYEKNDVSPFEIPMSYAKKVWWKGDCGHEWQRTIKARRTYDAFPCPYCAGRKVLAGFNDLATVRPDMIAEWSDKNSFTPNTVTQGSDRKVIWQCHRGHEWIAAIGSRIFYNSQCPECVSKQFSSRGEKELAEFIEELVGEENVVRNTRKVITPLELDIYLPEKKIAFEYNGNYWHSDAFVKSSRNMSAYDWHKEKREQCEVKGIQLFFVWEKDWSNKKQNIKTAIDNIVKEQVYDDSLMLKYDYVD